MAASKSAWLAEARALLPARGQSSHDRDASAANRALELLGKTDEVRLILDRHEHSGEGGQPLVPEHSDRDLARAVLDILRTANLSDAPAPASANKDEEPPHHGSVGMSAGTSPADGGTRRPTTAPDSALAATGIKRVGLAPGESEAFDNGAFLCFDGERQKYACFDGGGQLHSYKRVYEVAVAFAACRPEMMGSTHAHNAAGEGSATGAGRFMRLGFRGQLPDTKLPLPEAKLTKNRPPIPALSTPVHDPSRNSQSQCTNRQSALCPII
jgi:hypothetical protein